MTREEIFALVNGKSGFASHNGILLTVLEDGYCECRAELTENALNPHHIAHGGMTFALCDTAAGIAATTKGRRVVTQSANIHFLRTGTGSALTAKGRVVKSGAHTAYCVAEVYDDRDQLVVTASFDMYFVDRPIKV